MKGLGQEVLIYNASKRICDLFCAMVGVLVTSPLWLMIAIGIKLSSSGPVFYSTERVGRNNRSFMLYKFRSMHVYHPEDPNSGKKSEGGYIANAKRIFKFGGFLRKSKLDELPQLLNVLFSQMSVVGPRPVSKASVAKNYTGKYACIMKVKPGLACLDSLFDYAHGELFVANNDEYSNTIVPIRTELARIYVANRSIGLDFYCIARTIRLIMEITIVKKKSFQYTIYEQKAKDLVFHGVTEEQ